MYPFKPFKLKFVTTLLRVLSFFEKKASRVKLPRLSKYIHAQPDLKPIKSNLGLPKRAFPEKRKFQFSVPNLRFGSGVRFELSNNPKEPKNEWRFKFYFGNLQTLSFE